MKDFEKKLETMTKPTGAAKPPIEIKLAIINAQRSAVLGIWFIVVPCYFLLCVVMFYYFHSKYGIFVYMFEMMSMLDKDPYMWLLGPILLVGLPLVAIVLNALAITHFSFDRNEKVLMISIKFRWMNMVLLIISIAIVCVFISYILVENIHYKTI